MKNKVKIIQIIRLKNPDPAFYGMVLGLGEDSKVYLWNYNSSKWTLYGNPN